MPPSDDNAAATRGDLRHLEAALHRDMEVMRGELREATRKDLDGLRLELRADIRSLNNGIKILAAAIIGSIFASIITVVLAFIFG